MHYIYMHQIWKGASSSSLVTIAQTRLLNEVLQECGVDGRVATMCQGSGASVGQQLIEDKVRGGELGC